MRFSYFVLATALGISFAHATDKGGTEVVNDAWYTMQSNSTPWGYYHERIELREGRYTYRYEMLKKEKDEETYEENIGAIAEKNLTPFAFNLNKNGGGVIETIDGSFKKGSSGANNMKISIHGARNMNFDRALEKDGILEVFFPVWVAQNLTKLKEKARGSVHVFAENPSTGDFNSRSILYTYKGEKTAKKCHEIAVEMDSMTSVWCISATGVTESIAFNKGQVQVLKVSGESEARGFVKIKPKKGK